MCFKPYTKDCVGDPWERSERSIVVLSKYQGTVGDVTPSLVTRLSLLLCKMLSLARGHLMLPLSWLRRLPEKAGAGVIDPHDSRRVDAVYQRWRTNHHVAGPPFLPYRQSSSSLVLRSGPLPSVRCPYHSDSQGEQKNLYLHGDIE